MSIYVIVTTIWTYWLSLIILVGYRPVVKLYTIAVIYSTPAVGCTNHSLSITFFPRGSKLEFDFYGSFLFLLFMGSINIDIFFKLN